MDTHSAPDSMNSPTLYKMLNVCRRLSDKEAVIYRCFELIPGRGFVVQSADRINLPVSMDDMRYQERQLWELFCEEALDQRSVPYASIEEAIAAFDAEFGN
ncbi:hypothetical protein [Archangium sp.]|uniref:hypothetical protein n=1 Tax=Archangium sp. TaxID=1872627 RepID=UPI002D69F764|nr:hypothetical protein [Archangium sp.]HYO54610.1 hypothetical protein [Archangium sp.]